ncbi:MULTISPECIES: hypothetical protein [unclassified Anabaena]|uniref:hypothetical protein n=1 Tax=unclassified Anabaena TaxID=2619674 RepID=UPI002B1F9D1F|nr:hypothetical protein [Anabaena sp. UHCC 0399]MEA5565617.1 hypothetical protein [Anabaena sp. UHCC 0399]
MEINHRNFKNQIEINDLIDGAISDALARRSETINTDENLSDLSDAVAENVTGGLIQPITIAGYKPIVIAGYKPICPPITIGLIAIDNFK